MGDAAQGQQDQLAQLRQYFKIAEGSLVDDLPSIESAATALSFVPDNFSCDFADASAFRTTYQTHFDWIHKLQQCVKEGEKYISMLYTYRSCSKALPQVKTADQANKNEIYEATFEVLQPEIKRVIEFMHFQEATSELFCTIVSELAQQKGEIESVPELVFLSLIRMLDLLALLDALKDMKACLNNDFSFYKRSFGAVRAQSAAGEDQAAENNKMQLFLANQASISFYLKTELSKVPGGDEVLVNLMHLAADYIDRGHYVLPDEKHRLVRAILFGFMLMDSPELNVFQHKKLQLARFAKVLKRYPVVPVYGDMQLRAEIHLMKCRNFRDSKFDVRPDEKVKTEYSVGAQISQIRAEHDRYFGQFASMIDWIKRRENGEEVNEYEASAVYRIVLQGLQLMAAWSARITEQAAWKFAHPADVSGDMERCEYERVVVCNYDRFERASLVEAIALLKGLLNLLLQHEGRLTPFIQRFIHAEVQDFVATTIRSLLSVNVKKTKKKEPEKSVVALLKLLRATVSDWVDGVEPRDPALEGGKISSKLETSLRDVAPSVSQIQIIRAIVFYLMNDKTDKKKSIPGKEKKELDTFYSKSFYYEYLLEFKNTSQKAADLGQMWFREFYLELSKRIQFPIEMSLPWVLTEFALLSHGGLVEYVLYPLDLYNDAADRALRILQQRFLYDEIEAEMNLVFDQLVFKLSDQVWTYFKVAAATTVLDKEYKANAEGGSKYNTLQHNRYDVLLRQRHVQLLGRSIDLNQMIAQRMNTHVRNNLDMLLARFDSEPITHVVELKLALEVLKLEHEMLSRYMALDPWDSILSEMREGTSIVSFQDRITVHIIFELIFDIFPRYLFNMVSQRFVPAREVFVDEPPREAAPKLPLNFLYGSRGLNQAFSAFGEMFFTFFGRPHVEAIIELCGAERLPLIVGEVMNAVEAKLINVIAPYHSSLAAALQDFKPPLFDYGTAGIHGYYDLKLKYISEYPDLLPQVFQGYREMGNSMLFISLLEQFSSQEDCRQFAIAAPLLGIKWSEGQGRSWSMDVGELERCRMFTAGKSVAQGLTQTAPAVKDSHDASLKDVWKAVQLTNPKRVSSSLFKYVMQRFDHAINPVRAEWLGEDPQGGIPLGYTREFYRLWSVNQFVYCSPPRGEDTPCAELFGDGFNFAGMMIIHLLGQRARFETMDFSYYTLNVYAADVFHKQKPDADLMAFLKNVLRARHLNSLFFNMFDAHLAPSEREVVKIAPVEPQAEIAPAVSSAIGSVKGADDDLSSTISSSSAAGPPDVGSPPPPPPGGSGEGPADFGGPPPPGAGDADIGGGPPPPPPPGGFGGGDEFEELGEGVGAPPPPPGPPPPPAF